MSKESKKSRNKRTESAKRKIAEQRNRTEVNRSRKLMNRVRMHPQDRQALEALRRRAPKLAQQVEG